MKISGNTFRCAKNKYPIYSNKILIIKGGLLNIQIQTCRFQVIRTAFFKYFLIWNLTLNKKEHFGGP